ncbi:MAG: DUF3459 domain-containing protein, partial [Anaerolineales bacterium]|nr:DUF3459 domain-containing protein [Anaerolineales bacterium]
SRDNPKRDWYVWRDGQDDGPPNNWISIFGGSAWELDPHTGQYYYHAFLKEQPDLNWRNPAVKQAMWEMVRFWLDMGVDGFRLDAIGTIYEHPNLPDHPLGRPTDNLVDVHELSRDEYDQLMLYQKQQPGLHELMKELRALVDEYPGDRVLVGEDEDVAFHGSGDDELHLVFNFPLMRVDRLTPEHIRTNQALRLSELPPEAWPCNTLGNHDTPRSWDRYGDGVHDAELARLHIALMLTLKGTPFLYNGEEIGMSNLILERLEQLRDTAATARYERLVQQGGRSPAEALEIAIHTTRDRCRSPMQWNATPNAGFSSAEVQTWLPVHENYAQGVNVAAQQNDPNSLLSFYKQLLQLRRNTPALIAGDYHALHAHSDAYYAFLRYDEDSGQRCLVVLNFTAETQTIIFDLPQQRPQLLFSSANRTAETLTLELLKLAPFEIFIAAL